MSMFPNIDHLVFPTIDIKLDSLMERGYIRGMRLGDYQNRKGVLPCVLVPYYMNMGCDGATDNVVELTFVDLRDPARTRIDRQYILLSPVWNAYPFPSEQRVTDDIMRRINEQLKDTVYRCTIILFRSCKVTKGGAIKRMVESWEFPEGIVPLKRLSSTRAPKPITGKDHRAHV